MHSAIELQSGPVRATHVRRLTREPRRFISAHAPASQAPLMMEVYAEVLSDRSLRHVAAIDFSWFPDECQAPRFSRDAPEMGLGSRHATWRP